MKQCNNQACHTSLQRHRDDLALLHLSRIKSLMCPKCEVSRPSESAGGADFCFPDDHPKMTRPGFGFYHLRHLSQSWGIGRAQPPRHQSPVFGPSQAGPCGRRPGHWGPTNRHGACVLFSRGQCQDSFGTNVQQMAPRAQGDIFTHRISCKNEFAVKVTLQLHMNSGLLFFFWFFFRIRIYLMYQPSGVWGCQSWHL